MSRKQYMLAFLMAIPIAVMSQIMQQAITIPEAQAAQPIFSGAIVFISSGSCPAGYTQVSSAGNYPLLTVAANGDVGTTGGSTSYTPAGTNSGGAFTDGAISWPVNVPTFTGSALASTTFSIATGSGSFKGTSSGGFSTVGGAAPGSTGATTSKSPGTPAGTIAWPANPPTIAAGNFTQPTFSGTPATIQPNYIKLIGCQAN